MELDTKQVAEEQQSPLFDALAACSNGEANLALLSKLENQYNAKALHLAFNKACNIHQETTDELRVWLRLCESDIETPVYKDSTWKDNEYVLSKEFLKEARNPNVIQFISEATYVNNAQKYIRTYKSKDSTTVETWFSACVEDLTSPKEGPEYTQLPFNADFINQGLVLASALMQIGNERASIKTGDYSHGVWEHMRKEQCFRIRTYNYAEEPAIWYTMRAMLNTFIIYLERLQSTPNVYNSILAPHGLDSLKQLSAHKFMI